MRSSAIFGKIPGGGRVEKRLAPSDGFTLVELMISLAILSLIFILIYGTFSATYRASEQMEEEADLYRLARLGFYHLARDLSMIHKAESSAAPGAPLFAGEDRSRSEGGEEFPNDAVRFATVSHGRTMRDAPESDAAVISYYLREEALIHEAALSNGKVVENEIGEHLRGLNFRYLHPTSRLWLDRWDPEEHRNQPPLAVEVELILQGSGPEARRFKTWVEIPSAGRL